MNVTEALRRVNAMLCNSIQLGDKSIFTYSREEYAEAYNYINKRLEAQEDE